jgi:hypothetical protein
MVAKLRKTPRTIVRFLGLNPRAYGLALPVVRSTGKCREIVAMTYGK